MNASEQEQLIREAALRFPIGRAVRFYPVATKAEFETTRVTSRPWVLSNGVVLVTIDGRRGGVLIDHLEVI